MSALISTGVKLPASDLKKLRKIAANEQRSVGFLIREAVNLYLRGKREWK